MPEVDSQLREPNRNELFARAARAIGDAETAVSRGRKLQTLEGAWNTLDMLVRSNQSMLMLIVQLERSVTNLHRR